MTLPSMDALDAELSRLLDDEHDDVHAADVHAMATFASVVVPPAAVAPPPPPPPPADELVAQVAALEQRVVALEALLADSLQAFQELAEQRLERAAMDAAISVRRAIDAVDGVDAVQHI